MKGHKADRVWIDEWRDWGESPLLKIMKDLLILHRIQDLIGQPTTGGPKGHDVEQQVEKDRISQLPSQDVR